MRSLLRIFTVIPVVLLNACISLLPDPGVAPKKVWLDPNIEVKIKGPPSTNVLSVTRPTSTKMLDSERLRVRDLKGDIPLVDHIAGVEWQEHLPLMIQRHLVQNIKRSQHFKAVGIEEDSFDRNLVLEGDIQHFDVVILKDKMYAEVTFSAKLLEAKGRDILWQKTFNATTPISTHRLVDFILGLTVSYEEVLRQIVRFLLPQGKGCEHADANNHQ